MTAAALVLAGLSFVGLLAALMVAVMVACATRDTREALPALLVALALVTLLCGLALRF